MGVPEAFAVPGPVDAAEGPPQPARIRARPRIAAVRTGQWYCRAPLRLRRGGGTGRRVGLKNRCPQGRSGSTPDLGTKKLIGPKNRREAPFTSPRRGEFGPSGKEPARSAVHLPTTWGGRPKRERTGAKRRSPPHHVGRSAPPGKQRRGPPSAPPPRGEAGPAAARRGREGRHPFARVSGRFLGSRRPQS